MKLRFEFDILKTYHNEIFVFLNIMWKFNQTAAEDPCGVISLAIWPAAFLMSWHRPNFHQCEGTLDLLSVGLHNASASWLVSTFSVCVCMFQGVYTLEWARLCVHACFNMPVRVFEYGRVQPCLWTCFLCMFFDQMCCIFTRHTCEMAIWMVMRGTLYMRVLCRLASYNKMPN